MSCSAFCGFWLLYWTQKPCEPYTAPNPIARCRHEVHWLLPHYWLARFIRYYRYKHTETRCCCTVFDYAMARSGIDWLADCSASAFSCSTKANPMSDVPSLYSLDLISSQWSVVEWLGGWVPGTGTYRTELRVKVRFLFEELLAFSSHLQPFWFWRTQLVLARIADLISSHQAIAT